MAKTKSDISAEILAIDPEAVLEGRTVAQLQGMLEQAKSNGNAHSTPAPEGEQSEESTIEDIVVDDEPKDDEHSIEDVFERDDDDKEIVEPMILITSHHKGLVYAMPMGDPKTLGRAEKGREHRSLSAQLGYNEVPLSIWEAVRLECLKKGFKEYGRTVAGGVASAKGFGDFTPHEQSIISRNCNDVKALRRWQQLAGLDAAVMTAVNAQIEKIVNWKPGNA